MSFNIPWPNSLTRLTRLGAGLCLWAALLAPAAWAHPLLPGSRLQGEATLSYLGFKVYHARLWTLATASTALALTPQVQQALVLELEYQRAFKGRDIAERSLQEMNRVAQFSPAQAQQWLTQMQRIFPDVKAGDRISGVWTPGKGVQFWHNEREAGQVSDPGFAPAFLGIWLSPRTSEPAMRLKLLGQTSSGTQP